MHTLYLRPLIYVATKKKIKATIFYDGEPEIQEQNKTILEIRFG